MMTPYDTLADVLPNRQYNAVGDGEPAKSIAGVAVVGNISAVEKGHCYYMPDGDAPSGTQIPFGDDRALWCTIDATVDVTDVLATAPGETVGEEPPTAVVDSATVRLPLYPGDSFEDFKLGLESLPDTVFFLSGMPSLPNETDKFGLTGGTLMAPIVDGELTLPLLPPEDAEELLAGNTTLPSLVSASDDSSVTEIAANDTEGMILGS